MTAVRHKYWLVYGGVNSDAWSTTSRTFNRRTVSRVQRLVQGPVNAVIYAEVANTLMDQVYDDLKKVKVECSSQVGEWHG
jgi:hypothetical protein